MGINALHTIQATGLLVLQKLLYCHLLLFIPVTSRWLFIAGACAESIVFIPRQGNACRAPSETLWDKLSKESCRPLVGSCRHYFLRNAVLFVFLFFFFCGQFGLCARLQLISKLFGDPSFFWWLSSTDQCCFLGLGLFISTRNKWLFVSRSSLHQFPTLLGHWKQGSHIPRFEVTSTLTPHKWRQKHTLCKAVQGL